jgi:hypothetical protein
MGLHMKAISIERIGKAIEVNARLSVVYNQWTQFEEFPKFMEGVKSVKQLDDKRLAWRAEILGQEVEWEAEITEQVPDQRISWRSTSGRSNTGTVYFSPMTTEKTRVMLAIEYEPLGAAERIANTLGVLSFRIARDMRRFRRFVEERGAATGAWRGYIPLAADILEGTDTRKIGPERELHHVNDMNPGRYTSGKIGWALLWILGVPLPVLLIIFLLRGCT